MIIHVDVSLDFETREQLDAFAEQLVTGGNSDVLEQVRYGLVRQREVLPAASDWSLVPEIIAEVNKSMETHPEKWHRTTPATKIYWEDHFNQWMTDNYQKLGRSLPKALEWLRKEINA